MIHFSDIELKLIHEPGNFPNWVAQNSISIPLINDLITHAALTTRPGKVAKEAC